MTVVPTFTATIYVGCYDKDWGVTYSVEMGKQICIDYVNDVGLCISVTETEFIYTNGREPGFIVGLINYPRFPSTPEIIRQHALTLAEKLRKALGQHRVTVVFPDETVMLEMDFSGPEDHPEYTPAWG